MNNVIPLCPRRTPWCTEHTTDGSGICASDAIDVGAGCAVWLIEEIAGIAPTIVVDVPTTGGDLSLEEAGALRDALLELREAVIYGRPVAS